MDAPAKPLTVPVVVPIAVPLENINGALLTAFEGGSNYWARIKRYVKPRSFKFTWDMADAKKENRPIRLHPYADFPVNNGGAVVLSDPENPKKTYRLDMKAIEKGLLLTAKLQPKVYAKLIGDPDRGEVPDANDADIFLQLCVLGDVVYA